MELSDVSQLSATARSAIYEADDGKVWAQIVKTCTDLVDSLSLSLLETSHDDIKRRTCSALS